jgi:WD40 repeat protein
VEIWFAGADAHILVPAPCGGRPLALAVANDGDRVAVGYVEGFVGMAQNNGRRWSTTCLRLHASMSRALTFNATGTILASAGMESETDWRIRLTNTGTFGSLVEPFGRHRGPIYALAFSNTGDMLLSGGMDDTVDAWDVATGTPLGSPLRGQPVRTYDLMFDPAGVTLLGWSDETVTTWDFDVTSWIRRACRSANRDLTRQEWVRYVGAGKPQRCSRDE